MLPVFLVAAVTLSVTAPELWALPFSKTKIIIEVNATAGDAGIQISVDAPGWTLLEVFDPNGLEVFEGSAKGSVEMQGVSEFFFESSEPPFDQVSLAAFLERFPEGMYTFVGLTNDGQTLNGKATLTHNIPAGPVILAPTEGAVVNLNDTVV
ncbi:MAG: hypothetical protein L0312_01990, partial [Acidobacteria bacterium]|nr:hypothetical protein [Acidobacteriota bacterium]